MTITRRQAREWVVQMLTAADLNPPENVDDFIESEWAQLKTIGEEEGGPVNAHGGLKRFAEERIRGVLANREELDKIIVPRLENWDMYRLGTVERAVLRLGAWELKNTDVPPPVIINEAIDLVNWFSTPKSRTLVNGVLDMINKQG